MVQRRTEFPELEAYRLDLSAQLRESTRQINDGIYHDQPNGNAEAWNARIRKQLDEVNYILNFFELVRFRESQGWKTWQTVIVIIITALALSLSIFAVWRG